MSWQEMKGAGVKIVTNDGRNYVDSSRRTYDVISSEPPNIWVAGVSGLFTQEFYRSAKAHLNPGGVLCQWMPLYEMQAPDFRITLHTIQSVFPYLRFWAVGGDIALVAWSATQIGHPLLRGSQVRQRTAYGDQDRQRRPLGGLLAAAVVGRRRPLPSLDHTCHRAPPHSSVLASGHRSSA